MLATLDTLTEEQPVAEGIAPETPGLEGLRYYGARPPFQLIDIAELWRYRDLIGVLALRDLQVRYRQALVGAAWALLQPLTQLLLFSAIFGLLQAKPSTGDVPYPLVLISGLILWQLFASGVTQATSCLVDNRQLVGKVYFPRLVLPLAALIPPLVDFALSCAILVATLVWYGVTPGWSLLAAPLFVMLTVLSACACGVWLSALNALYRDIGFMVPFLLQMGFFASPIVYEARALSLSETWRTVLALNPMVGAVEGFRWAITGVGAFPGPVLALSTLAMLCVLIAGLAYFRRVERFLADRI